MRSGIQALIVVVLILIGAVAWLRFDPESAIQAGVPDGLIAMVSGNSSESGAQGDTGGRPPFGAFGGPRLVVLSTVGQASINDRVNAIGDGEALRSVTVVPNASGFLEAVNVSANQEVSAGTVLAVLDAEKETIARDQAALTVKIAGEKVERYERLLESRTVTQVQVVDARNELENARLALRNAQLELDRRSIKAPIDGHVGLIPVETGDYVTAQTEIATIDDRSGLLVDFWIPERFAAKITPELEVSASAIALPGSQFVGGIEAVASRVDRDSRTLQIRALIANDEDRLRPGMSFRVELEFPGESFPAVDPLAIQWSSDGPYVWKAIDGVSARSGIEIIQRNSDYVLVSGDIVPGEEVIIEGLQNMRPGSSLNVARRSIAPAAEGS